MLLIKIGAKDEAKPEPREAPYKGNPSPLKKWRFKTINFEICSKNENDMDEKIITFSPIVFMQGKQKEDNSRMYMNSPMIMPMINEK